MNDTKNLDKSKNSSTLNVEFDLVMPRPRILHRDECQIVPCRYKRQCKALDSISLCGVHFVSIVSDAHYLLCIFRAICIPALPISSHLISSLVLAVSHCRRSVPHAFRESALEHAASRAEGLRGAVHSTGERQ